MCIRDSYTEDIDRILNNAKVSLENKEYGKYVQDVLDEVDEVLFNIQVEEEMDILKVQEAAKPKTNWTIWDFDIKRIGIIGAILLIIGAIGLGIIELIKIKSKKLDRQFGVTSERDIEKFKKKLSQKKTNKKDLQ